MSAATPNPLGSLLDFSGKTALVAGVLDEHSIGWPIAKLLNDGGARVALSIQRKAVRRLLGAIPEQLTDPLILECDVSKDEQLERLFTELGQEFGQLDFLIHSIAYAPPASFQRRFLDIGRDDLQLAMDISTYSLIGLARGAFPLMKDRGGCILAMTYYAGEKVIPGYQLMSITKAALDNIIRNLAYDLAPHRIRVNGLSPGPTATKAGTSIPGFAVMQDHMKRFAPLQAEILNSDTGRAALFLCSPLADKITGEIVHIDGGYNILGMSVERPRDE